MTVQVHDPRLPGGMLEVDTDDPKAAAQAAQRYLAANAPKPAPSAPSSTWDAIRSIPGGLAKGAAAAAGIGGDVRDLTTGTIRTLGNWAGSGIGDKAAGYADTIMRALPITGAPTSTQISDVLSKPTGGYYKPQTDAGRYAETIASFAPAAVGGEGGLVRRAAQVALPAVASRAGGDIAASIAPDDASRPAYEEAGSTIGALAGGAGVAGVRPAIRSINRLSVAATGQSILDPSAEAAAALRRAVDRDGGTGTIETNARNYADSGASTPALIDVGGNNVRRLVRAAASTEGDGQNTALSYADRIRANLQDNVLGRARQLTPNTPQNAAEYAAQLESGRDAAATTNYRVPYSTPATVTPDMVDALQGPEGRGAIGQAYATARANRDQTQMAELQDLLSVASEQSGGRDPITGRMRTLSDALGNLSAGSLDRVRVAMRETAGSLAARGRNGMARGYGGRVRDIDTALDQTPGLAEARGAYRGASAAMDAVPVGQAALTTPSNEYAAEVARLAAISPDARTAAAVGHRQAITDAVASPAAGQTGVLNRLGTSTQQTQNLATSFGPAEGARFQQSVQNEVARLRNANFISPNSGSQTALRGADQSGFSQALHFMRAAPLAVAEAIWTKIRGSVALTPAERAEIVRMGTTEADLNALARSPRINPASRIAIPAAVGASQANGN